MLEPWHDFRFTSEPCQRKAWDLNPHGGKAARFSKPARRAVSGYLPYLGGPTENRTRISATLGRRLSRWTMSPFAFSGPAGESNPDLLVAGQASSRWTSRPCFLSEVRLGIEPSLPPYQSGVQPQHLQTTVFSQCSDPGWNRTITFLHVTQVSSPLDHGISCQ